ncbi:unnamed protein product [Cylicostephanus goldi]|uniref:Laminin G domain-containing protein n=1 Tax=Cylicostephanus goldi TaxID=71465 RepID=A0A3P6RWM7_CYLGO|nr:unnamed protein product [Cylicostephanus goldi]
MTIQSEEDDLLALKIENGVLVAFAGDDRASLELASAADEQWHYVSVRKTKDMLRVDVDDLHSKEEKRRNGDEVVSTTFTARGTRYALYKRNSNIYGYLPFSPFWLTCRQNSRFHLFYWRQTLFTSSHH